MKEPENGRKIQNSSLGKKRSIPVLPCSTQALNQCVRISVNSNLPNGAVSVQPCSFRSVISYDLV